MQFRFKFHNLWIFSINLLFQFAESDLDAWFFFLHPALQIIMSFNQKVILFWKFFQLFVQEIYFLITLIDGSVKLFVVLLDIPLWVGFKHHFQIMFICFEFID